MKTNKIISLILFSISLILISTIIFVNDSIKVSSKECCFETKSIDYFENSTLPNVSRTVTYNQIDSKDICIPKEENIIGLNCK